MISNIIFSLGQFYLFLIFIILTFASTSTTLLFDHGFDDDGNFGNYVFIFYETIFQQFPTALMP